MSKAEKNIHIYQKITFIWSCMNTIILGASVGNSLIPQNIEGFYYYIPGQSVVPICKAIMGLVAIVAWIVSWFFFGYCCYKAYKIKKSDQRKATGIICTRRIGIAVLLGIYSLFVTAVGVDLGTYNHSDFWLSAQYYEYECDEHTIVIRETSEFKVGGFDVYQVEKFNIAYEIGGDATDDGYQNDGEYELKWTEDGLYVGFYFDSGHREELKREVYCEWFEWEDLWNS